MAVPPQTNEAFLREVDEELRRDQIIGIWRTHGRWIALGIGGALAAFAGVLAWQHHVDQQAAAEGQQLAKVYDLLAASNTKDAAQPLTVLAGSSVPTYRALAQTVQADIALRDADTNGKDKGLPKLKEAAAKFAAIAADPKVPQPLRDLALIRQTSAELDQLPPAQVVARLSPLAVKGGPWLGSAGELVVIADLALGRTDAARAMVKLITADPAVPDPIRQRVVQLGSAIDNHAAPAAVATDKDSKKQ